MKKIEVLMSTYNGEKYVERQILSILQQTGVEVHLTIRDDGSRDRTTLIIEDMMMENPNLSLIKADNVGYKKSFLGLLSICQDADYYAFADQDDVWLDTKLIEAVRILDQEPDDIKLYASNLILVDENLDEIGRTKFKSAHSKLRSDFTRHRYAGCTYVMSHSLRQMATRINEKEYPLKGFPTHDAFISALAFCCGSVMLDERAFIQHVRLNSSVTPGGNGIMKRLKTERDMVFNNENTKFTLASILWDLYEHDMNSDARRFLSFIIDYKKNISSRLRLISESYHTTGVLLFDIETTLKILLLKY